MFFMVCFNKADAGHWDVSLTTMPEKYFVKNDTFSLLTSLLHLFMQKSPGYGDQTFFIFLGFNKDEGMQEDTTMMNYSTVCTRFAVSSIFLPSLFLVVVFKRWTRTSLYLHLCPCWCPCQHRLHQLFVPSPFVILPFLLLPGCAQRLRLRRFLFHSDSEKMSEDSFSVGQPPENPGGGFPCAAASSSACGPVKAGAAASSCSNV